MTVANTRNLKVLLIDTNNHRKNKIKNIIEPCEDITIVDSHEKTEHVLKFIEKLKPQILLLDLNLEVKIIAEITKQFDDSIRVIGLARETPLSIVLEATELGARGVLANICSLFELPTRIRMIYRGDFQLDPQISEMFMRYLSYKQFLTPTQMKVLLGILERKDRVTMSAELKMSNEALRQNIYRIGKILNIEMRGEQGIREHFFKQDQYKVV